MGIGHYLSKVYNYHDSPTCDYKRYGVLFRLVGLVWNGVVIVETL
jgi:hypothetical protein